MEQSKPDEESVLEHPPHQDNSAADAAHELPLDESDKTTAADFEPEHINPSEADTEDHAETTESNPASDLDPIVLSSLVIQLRKSLEEAYKERDELREATGRLGSDLEVTRSSLADLEKQHVYVSAAKEAVENELKAEKDKREAAEESVTLLRSRLEEARKAVTGLQTQDRRRPTLGHGAPPVGEGFVEDLTSDMGVGEGTDKRSKRASVLGIASLKAHRRTSSQSEPGFESVSFPVNTSGPSSAMPDARAAKSSAPPVPPARPNTGGLRELRLGVGAASSSGQGPPSPNPSVGGGLLEPVSEAKDARRWSALSVLRSSPKQPPTGIMDDVEELDDSPGNRTRPSLIPRSSSGSLQDRLNAATGVDASRPSNAATEAISLLQSEVNRLRAQLAMSQEARVASENAVKVLREFMSAGNSGEVGDEERDGLTSPMQGLRLPPLPTDSQADDEEDSYMLANKDAPPKQSGWSLRLWKDKEHSGKVASPQPTGSSSGKATATSPFGSPVVMQEPNATSSGVLSTPLASFVSSWSKGVASTPTSKAQDTPASSPQPTTPGRMLSFFGKTPTTPQQQQPQGPPEPSEDPAEESASRADPAIIAASEAIKQGESEIEVVDLSDVPHDAKPESEVGVKAEHGDEVETEKEA